MTIEEMLMMERENLREFTKDSRTDGCISGKKIFEHLDKLNILKNHPEIVTPITVEFHPSNICNHHCPMCVFGTPDVRGELRKTLFDVGLLNKLIYDFIKMGIKAIGISGGGEPLCHPKIVEILNSFGQEFDVGIVTNGQLIESSRAHAILSNCQWCRVSVDAGSQEVYEKMHGMSADFEALVEKVKMLAAYKMERRVKTTLGISFLLTPGNFLDMFRAVNIFGQIEGIDYFQIKPIVVTKSERVQRPDMIFWDRRIFEMVNAVKMYETEKFKIYAPSYKFINMVLCDHTGLQFRKCWGHPFYPTVAADGSVLVCCYFLNFLYAGDNKGCYGKITKDRGFADVWNDVKRFGMGDSIDTKKCPCNCKLSETNTALEELNRIETIHPNFIN